MDVLRFAEAACVVLFTTRLGLLVVDMGHTNVATAWDSAARKLTADGWDFDPDEADIYEEDREGYILSR